VSTDIRGITGATGEVREHTPVPVSAMSSSASWLALALGCLALPFAYGVDNIPCAAWLAPLFLLRFVRTQRLRISMPVLLVVQMAATAFQLRGMFIADGSAYWIGLFVSIVPILAPYAIDRVMIRRLPGLLGTLVFPVSYAIIDYLGSFGPYGSG